MIITKEQSMAYTEVLEVLKYMPKEEVYKIPENILKYYKNNMDSSYEFSIDETKPFKEQILMEKSKIVLALLFREYWATEKQKEIIKQKEKYDLYKEEMSKSEKYNVNNIFKDNKETIKENQALIEYKKEKWYKRFFNFIKNKFKK